MAYETLLQDFRYAIRMIRKNLGFSFAVVSILALGIGANSAIFSVVNAALLRALPFQDPNGLVMVNADHPKLGKTQASAADFIDWQSRNSVFLQLALEAVTHSSLKAVLLSLSVPEHKRSERQT
jgi:hypothetical protein